MGSEDAPIDNGKLALSDSEAKYLQDAEHLGGFVLGDLTLPQVGAAISDGDEERLESFLSKDFAGEVFPSESGTVALLDVADVRTWRTPRDKTRKVDAREFVSQVMAWRSEFKKLASASLKVMLMRPESHGEFDGPWVGTLKLRLTGADNDGQIVEREVRFRCRLTSLTEDQPDRRGWLAGCAA